jgi:hypothetical protein
MHARLSTVKLRVCRHPRLDGNWHPIFHKSEQSMRIIDVIKYMLPYGTAHGLLLKKVHGGGFYSTLSAAETSWTLCPAWPPDVFAVAATLVERSNCCMLAGPAQADRADHLAGLQQIFADAAEWVTDYRVHAAVQQRWDALYTLRDTELSEIKRCKEVRDVLFGLLATADEASNGMGWAPVEPGAADAATSQTGKGPNMLVKLVMTSLLDKKQLPNDVGELYVLPFAPASLCSLVAQDIAVVLPKSMTASVGCTIRSLSHHLALLPGSLQVQPSWKLVDKSFGLVREPGAAPGAHAAPGLDGTGASMPARRASDRETKVRLLVVPYPFAIPETSFHLREDAVHMSDRASTGAFFELQQQWLEKQNDGEHASLDAGEITTNLLRPLLRKAKKECGGGDIHGIVMPECALTAELAYDVATHLRRENIDFFITGVLDKSGASGLPRNRATTYLFPREQNTDDGNAPLVVSSQSKHHRWSLDPSQVRRYALNFPERSKATDGRKDKQWWEAIDISERDLPFYAIRHGVSLAVLICEDLARTDPAMTVIRAVGPNLVIALLMDGPQLATRWPARYATVLADDPGSSVLTLTCAALVDRANWQESRPVRSIALWRDAGGTTQELNLPTGHQGMCLTLAAEHVAQFTLDGRSDVSATQKFNLTSAIPLAISSRSKWFS